MSVVNQEHIAPARRSYIKNMAVGADVVRESDWPEYIRADLRSYSGCWYCESILIAPARRSYAKDSAVGADVVRESDGPEYIRADLRSYSGCWCCRNLS